MTNSDKAAAGETCQVCKEKFPLDECYEYRGFIACQKHFDELQERVDSKRNEVMKVADSSVRSQADGEWSNGGYKNMKVDVSGRPIPTKVKEPQILSDYENGIL